VRFKIFDTEEEKMYGLVRSALRTAVNESGLSHAEIAKKSDISEAELESILYGDAEISSTLFIDICGAINQSPNTVFAAVERQRSFAQ
jgi:hypothetical protein